MVPTSSDFGARMETPIDYVKTALDAKMKVTAKGFPFWYGRDVMAILSYENWDNFKNIVEKAVAACNNSGKFSNNHFLEIREMVDIGSGAKRGRENFVLSKYACYLIAMSGDTSKPEVATAQTYFAIQTTQREVEQSLSDAQRRLLLRNRVKDANKNLSQAAKGAGVQNFAFFQDAGYRGLYGDIGLQDIKAHKGIPKTEDFLDCIDREELAANEFRITQTEAKLRRENIKGETEANRTHYAVGRKVRKTIEDIGGTMPEKLPAAPSIKKIASKQSKDSERLGLPQEKDKS
jgi:DNA-damage-inducible protein D